MLRKPLTIQVIASLALVLCVGSAQSQTGTITTFAGGGNPTGQANAVPIGQPWSVIQDSSGNTYIADNHSNRIFEVNAATGVISVIAGNTADGLTSGTQVAIQTSLSFPQGLALDTTNGALYIADDGNNEIRVVNTNTSGSITLFTGSATPITIPAGDIADVAGLQGGSPCLSIPSCGDTQFATTAGLNAPADIVVDSSGDIFIADTGDNVIREVNGNTGIISRIAGVYCDKSCALGTGDGGPALSATLDAPTWISLDSLGNIYIADTNDDAIRVVNTSTTTNLILFSTNISPITISPGDIDTVAGSPTLGTACVPSGIPPQCGDTGSSTSAQLNLPGAVLVDSSSNIYIADSGDYAVREVNGSTGEITLLAGSYVHCSPLSPGCGDTGPATSALLNNPTDIFLGTSNIFIADELDAAIRTVPIGGGNISTVAGVQFNRGWYGDGGPATSAELQNPVSVAADSSGNVYIADTPSNIIRKVDAAGTISSVAGVLLSCHQSSTSLCGDGGPATAANLWLPSDVFADSAGNLFIADSMDNVIRKVSAQTGFISTVAGDDTSFSAGFGGDGTLATSVGVLLSNPSGVFVDTTGDIFIADTANNRIREVTAIDGHINTVAGDGTKGYLGDGSAAIAAELNSPTGVFVDAKGNLYITDSGNDVIRMVDPKGTISTVAGNGTAGFTGDGSGLATAAELSSPWGAFVDFLGNLFISDQQNNVIRVANLSTTGTNTVGGVAIPAGQINTVVGLGQTGGFAGDGLTLPPAQPNAILIHEPLGMRSDSAGNLYFADRLNWRVRKVAGIVATTPTANLSIAKLTFASQAVGSSSSEQSVTVTNNGNISPLQYTISFSGTNAADFLESDSCNGSVASNGKTCTLNVTFKPTAVGSRSATMTITDSNASIAQTVTLTGTATQATSTTTLKSSANPSNVSQSVTFTATVTASGGGTPTGSVTFKDGSTTLGSAVSLSSGVATLAISTLTVATHSITAVYGGDTDHSGSTSTALSQVVDQPFTVTATALSPSSTISPGNSATSTITIASENGFSSAVSLACTVASSATPAPSSPPGCAVTTAVTPAANKTATATLTISTTAATAALIRPAIERRSVPLYAVWLLFPAILLSAAGLGSTSRRKLRGKLLRSLLVFIALMGSLFLAACGGGSSSSTGTGGGSGTSAGAYTVTVTATATGVTAQTTTVNVTVQ